MTDTQNVVVEDPMESETLRPPNSSASEEEKTSFRASLVEFVHDWCNFQENSSVKFAEYAWSDFINEFDRKSLQYLNKECQRKLRSTLIGRGVFIKIGRGISMIKSLEDCYDSEICPVISQNVTPKFGITTAAKSVTNEDSNKKEESFGNVLTDKRNESDVVLAQNTSATPTDAVVDGKSTSELGDTTDFGSKLPHGPSRSTNGRLTDVLKSLSGITKFRGGFDSDISELLEKYEDLCKIVEVPEKDMIRGITMLLEGPALTRYNREIRGQFPENDGNYNAVVKKILSIFTSSDQKSRLLNEWRNVDITEWFKRFPDLSQTQVFGKLVERMMRTQLRLESQYHSDVLLRDQLITSVSKMPIIRDALKQVPPNDSRQVIDRVGRFLSSSSRSASEDVEAEGFYSLGHRFGGEARQRTKTSRSHRKPGQYKAQKIRGCWVCRADHKAADHHSPEEVRKALRKMQNQNAYVAVDDFNDLFLAQSLDENKSDSDSEFSDEENSAHFVTDDQYGLQEINASIESELADNAFIASSRIFSGNTGTRVNSRTPSKFRGMIIDTGANRVSIISLQQYQSYCKEFRVPAQLDQSTKQINGIGGKQLTIGSTTINVPFPDLKVFVDVTFHVIDGAVPTLWSRRDIKESGIDLSIQREVLIF